MSSAVCRTCEGSLCRCGDSFCSDCAGRFPCSCKPAKPMPRATKSTDVRHQTYNEILKEMRRRSLQRRRAANAVLRDMESNSPSKSPDALAAQAARLHAEADAMHELIIAVRNMRNHPPEKHDGQ